MTIRIKKDNGICQDGTLNTGKYYEKIEEKPFDK